MENWNCTIFRSLFLYLIGLISGSYTGLLLILLLSYPYSSQSSLKQFLAGPSRSCGRQALFTAQKENVFDEFKLNRLQADKKRYCWRKTVELIQRYHVKQTVKYHNRKIMLWLSFTCYYMGPLHLLDVIWRKEERFCKPFLPILWTKIIKYIFQQNDVPQHSAKIVKKWILDGKKNFNWPNGQHKIPI